MGNGVRHSREFQYGGIEGATCDELNYVVIDKYFVDPETAFARRTGIAICSHCVVIDECRENALNATMLPRKGIVAGVLAREIWAARSWRNFDNGVTDTPPRVERPEWFTEFSEAADAAMEGRMMEDAL